MYSINNHTAPASSRAARPLRPVFAFLLAALALAAPSGACLTAQANTTTRSPLELHVAPTGRPAAAGTAQDPFSSIAEAQEAARRRIAAGLRADLVVTIQGGLYPLSAPLRFDNRDSGTSTHSVTYRGAPGETVILSGGRTLSGPWQPETGGAWSLALPQVASGDLWFRDLWLNGQRQHYNNQEEWATFSWILTISDASTAAAADRADQPGRFALDRASGTLFVNPGPDQPAQGEWIAGILPTLIEISGDKTAKITNFRLENLGLRHTGWTLPSWGYPGLWGGVYKGENFTKDIRDEDKTWHAIDAAIEVEFADHVTLSDLRLKHLGGMGIAFGRGVENSLVQGCLIADTASTGIYEGWQGNAPRKAVDGWSGHVGRRSRVGPKIPNLDIQWGEPDVYPKNNRITDNYLQDIGMSYDAMGILSNGVWNPRIEHNYVARTSYIGICINDCTGDSVETKVLRYNHIAQHQIGVRGKGLHDGAAVYTSNSNVPLLIEGNYVRDGIGGVNSFHGQSKGAFYPDEGAYGTRIHRNVVDGGLFLYYTNNCEGLDLGDNIVGPTIAQRQFAIASTGPREPFRSRLGLTTIPVAFASSSWVVNGSDKHPPILAFDGDPKTFWRSTPLGSTNLAAGKPATASSGPRPASVTDGDPATFWKPATLKAGEWLQIDLGATHTLRQVSINWNGRGTDPAKDNGRQGPARNWEILTSTDGEVWKAVSKGKDDEARHDCAIQPTTARWVRVQVGPDDTEFFSIAEIAVLGLPETAAQWLAYDFGAPTEIAQVTLQWGRFHAVHHSLLASEDGQTWTEIHRQRAGRGGREALAFTPVTARYLKLELHESSAKTTEGAYELAEFITQF